MSMSTGLKNWHWRSKNTKPWAEQWFGVELVSAATGKTRIVKVKDVEGDCDLGMRKSKLVTIYDLKITCAWEGELADGTVAKGSLTAIEVSHDMDEDEYVFESTLEEGSGSEASALKEDARKALADKLRSKFQLFPKAMIEAHGKDLLADAETSAGVSPADSGRSTPAAATPANNTVISSSSGSKAPSTSGPSASNASKAKAGIRTTKLKVDGDFMASADDLFDLLTNEQKVPSWSRNKATIKPEVGAEVSLFGGNISGKMTEVVKPTKFVQTWRAPTWPEGHYGELTAVLDQGSGSTRLLLELDGVPAGKEDETEKGLEIFYIRSLKQIGSVKFRVPPHLWNLHTSTRKSGKGLQYYLLTTLSTSASVLLPVGCLALFGWLLYNGPTFQPQA